jgi:hypothetical protein
MCHVRIYSYDACIYYLLILYLISALLATLALILKCYLPTIRTQKLRTYCRLQYQKRTEQQTVPVTITHHSSHSHCRITVTVAVTATAVRVKPM